MKLAHMIVRGLVQGVGFRWFARSEAIDRALVGTVKNLSDGSVEIWVGGSEKSIKDLIERLQIGNGYCKVIENVVDWSDDEISWNEFSIIS